MIGRAPCLSRLRPFESQAHQIQLLNKDVDHTHRIIFIDPVIQSLREEHTLRSVLPIDVSAHAPLQQRDA